MSQFFQKQDEIMGYVQKMDMHEAIPMKTTSKLQDMHMHAWIKLQFNNLIQFLTQLTQ